MPRQWLAASATRLALKAAIDAIDTAFAEAVGVRPWSATIRLFLKNMDEEHGPEENEPADESPQKRRVIIITRFSVPAPLGGEVELRVMTQKDFSFFNELCREPPPRREFAIRLLAHHTSKPESMDYAAWDDIALLDAAQVWWDHNHFSAENRTKIESLESFRDTVCQEETKHRQRTERLFRSLQPRFLENLALTEAHRHKSLLPESRYAHESEHLRRLIEDSASARRATEMSFGAERTADLVRAARSLDPTYRYRFEPALETAREHLRDLDILGGKKLLAETVGAGATLEQIGIRARDLELAHGVIAGRFRGPLASEMAQAISSVRASLSDPTMARYLPSPEQLRAIAGGIHSPWIDSADVRRSYEGLGKLAALASAVERSSFDLASAKAIRSVLGDWRGCAIPEGIFADSILRDRFYLSNGFDAELVARPEPAFTESLRATHLLRPTLLQPKPTETVELQQEESTEERALRTRMQDLHGLLWRLERDLRDFIESAMTGQFGPDWAKRRLPGNRTMYDSWVEKQDEHTKKGGARGRLIDYADFTDYEQIITKADNWKEVFRSRFRDKQSLSESLRRLYPVQLATMHGRSISKIDFVLANAEVTRLLVALGKIPRE